MPVIPHPGTARGQWCRNPFVTTISRNCIEPRISWSTIHTTVKMFSVNQLLSLSAEKSLAGGRLSRFSAATTACHG